MPLLVLKYWREVAIGVLLIALAIGAFTWNGHERAKGAAVIVKEDVKASAVVQARADAQTEANAINAALAEQGAKSAQNAVDAYMAAHPVGVVRLPEPAGDRGGCVREARAVARGTSDPGAGPAVVPAVPRGGESADLGPAIDEIVRSASRVAVIYGESKAR